MIEKGAKEHGYDETQVLTWPGQLDGDGKNLSFEGALEVARNAIQRQEEEGKPYSILARSFGTTVACELVGQGQVSCLNTVILWGPPPYWELWSLFKRDFLWSQKTAKSKGTMIDEPFFDSLKPFESLVAVVNHRAVIVCGTEDMYATPGFFEYLKGIAVSNGNFSFRTVEGAPHEVTSDLPDMLVDGYMQALFSDTEDIWTISLP